MTCSEASNLPVGDAYADNVYGKKSKETKQLNIMWHSMS